MIEDIYLTDSGEAALAIVAAITIPCWFCGAPVGRPCLPSKSTDNGCAIAANGQAVHAGRFLTVRTGCVGLTTTDHTRRWKDPDGS